MKNDSLRKYLYPKDNRKFSFQIIKTPHDVVAMRENQTNSVCSILESVLKRRQKEYILNLLRGGNLK